MGNAICPLARSCGVFCKFYRMLVLILPFEITKKSNIKNSSKFVNQEWKWNDQPWSQWKPFSIFVKGKVVKWLRTRIKLFCRKQRVIGCRAYSCQKIAQLFAKSRKNILVNCIFVCDKWMFVLSFFGQR